MSDFATFEELAGERFLNVTVATDYGDARHFRIKLPGYVRWNELWHSIRDVPIPNTRAGSNGKEPNPFDVEYKARQADVDMRRKLLIVAWGLSEAGMTIPGATIEEKADAIGRWDGAIINALFAALRSAYEAGRAYKDDNGAVFRALHKVQTEGDEPLRDKPASVGEPERPVESGPDSE